MSISKSPAPAGGLQPVRVKSAADSRPNTPTANLGGTGLSCEKCGHELQDRWILPEGVQRIIAGLTPKALSNRRTRGLPPAYSIAAGRVRYSLSVLVKTMVDGTATNSREARNIRTNNSNGDSK